ncbi:Hypothetical predicted protein [Paramuricea clavata]|uniref:Uncharacterized protein n=1 Tax=Paramuricea clavata TaxID=317549 RepID=A0A6S7IH19_PARCT|nr:Hypothetical predicted protein [Paramuricea clavata]
MNKSWRKSNKNKVQDDQRQRSRKERNLEDCVAAVVVNISKTVHAVEASNNSSYEDGDFFIGVVNEVSDTNDEISLQLLIEGSDSIKAKLDTGAQVNVMPVHVYNSLKTKSKVLQPTKVKLIAYGGNRIGQGCLSHEYHIQLKPGVKPVVHGARKTPVSLRDKVKHELERMEKLNILRRVDEPTA